MKFWTPLACALLISGTTLAAHAKITRTVEKTFAVQPGGRLIAETQGGNITINSDDANQVCHLIALCADALRRRMHGGKKSLIDRVSQR